MTWLDRLVSGWGSDGEVRPKPDVLGDPEHIREVLAVLDELRPMFKADGGDVELVSIEDGWIDVRLRGACKHCHASDETLYNALEPRLKERLAWVRGVRTV